MGMVRQSLDQMLGASDVKTGLIEKLSTTLGVPVSFFYGEVGALPPEVETRELPLLPFDALAGALTGTDIQVMEYDCEKYVVPAFKDAKFLVRVSGDSMIPRYMSGDIVACKDITLDRLWFQWGKTYVISTTQGVLIKRIEPSEKEGCVSIHSYNSEYKPFDFPTDEINGIAIVVGLIRQE